MAGEAWAHTEVQEDAVLVPVVVLVSSSGFSTGRKSKEMGGDNETWAEIRE